MISRLVRRAAKLLCVGFHGKVVSPEVRELLELGVAGVIVFARNVGAPEELFELTTALKSVRSDRTIIAVDQEGGPVRRLRQGFTDVPAMAALGASNDIALARELGRVLGRELSAVGIDWNFAPVLDVHTNPQNPVIGARAIASDAERVGTLGVELALAMEAFGVASCAKHFPGHGDTLLDSHHALPRVTHGLERLRAVELAPFARAARASLASIMTAHVLFSEIDREFPATMSRGVVTGLLREELGYDGLVVSDDLEMGAIVDGFGVEQAIVRGVDAGVDLFLVCHSAERAHAAANAVASAVASGALALARFEAAERRVSAFLERFAASPRPRFDPTELRAASSLELARRLSSFAQGAHEYDATGAR